MPKGPYKSEEERRIAATFSLRDERLRYFRQALAIDLGHEPSRQECEESMRRIAQQGIDIYIKQRIEFSKAIIL
jgi:hypothetical protein